MFEIGPEKLLLVLVIALIFLGPQKLPEIARNLGKGLREIRQAGQAARQTGRGRFSDQVAEDRQFEFEPIQAGYQPGLLLENGTVFVGRPQAYNLEQAWGNIWAYYNNQSGQILR